MANPLFNLLNNNTNQFGNMNNFMNLISRFNSFKQNFQGDPKQQVQNMLNSGQMTQQQFNQLAQMATQFQNILK